MSIKHFHLFFIVVVTIFSWAVGIWSLLEQRKIAEAGGETSLFGVGIFFIAFGLLLFVYLIFFIKKLKKLGKDIGT